MATETKPCVTMESTGLRMRRRIENSDDSTCETQDFCADLVKADDIAFRETVQSEIAAAFNESLQRGRGSDYGRHESLAVLEEEALKMFNSVEAAEERDESNRIHNRHMQQRHLLLCMIGVLCTICPVLLIFDTVMGVFPVNYVRTLEIGSQQPSVFGSASRFCLHAVNLAREIRQCNDKEGGVYLWGCLGALMLILLMVRHATQRRVVMTPSQFARVHSIRGLIQEELNLQRAGKVRKYEHYEGQ